MKEDEDIYMAAVTDSYVVLILAAIANP